MSNINDKIDEIFGDEYIDKRLVLSPKRNITSKFKKKINGDNLNLNNKDDKLSETQHININNTKIKKQHKKTKDIKDSIGQDEKLNIDQEINDIINNDIKKEKKEIKESSNNLEKNENEKKGKKKEKEKEKKDLENNVINDLDLDNYPMPRRGRGQSHHIKNKVESLNVFKGILRKNSKKIGKKSKFDLEKEGQKKVEEKEKEESEEKEEKKMKKKKKLKKKKRKKICHLIDPEIE